LIIITITPQGTDTRMNNVINDFLMLSNIQFVENVSLLYIYESSHFLCK